MLSGKKRRSTEFHSCCECLYGRLLTCVCKSCKAHVKLLSYMVCECSTIKMLLNRVHNVCMYSLFHQCVRVSTDLWEMILILANWAGFICRIIVVFICVSLITKEVTQFLKCLFTFYVSSSCETSVSKCLASFSIGCLSFSVCFIGMLWIRLSLSAVCVVNIFCICSLWTVFALSHWCLLNRSS